jgi:hypothetical protein
VMAVIILFESLFYNNLWILNNFILKYQSMMVAVLS